MISVESLHFQPASNTKYKIWPCKSNGQIKDNMGISSQQRELTGLET